MSIITPNDKQKILVEDFISLAKKHLLTIQGQAITQTTYSTAAGAILPGSCFWNGYTVPDIPQQPEQDLQNLPKVSTKFKADDVPARNLFIENYDLEKELSGQGVIYDELKKSNGSSIKNSGRTAQTTYSASNSEARKAAEAYLGRAMTDAEFSDLISITYAEATTNQTERAWVMATILNRTRIGYTPGGIQNKKYNYATVTDIINQPWQFQPVTGTRFNPGPNANFLNGPNSANATSIYGAAAKILKDVPKAYTDFTSNDPRDYGPGTNTNYLFKLRAKPEAKIIGGTIFAY
jgi:hypothetical protein